MTEAEWLGCSDLDAMLAFLRGKGDERKLRLFGCACVRRVWPLLSHKASRQAVEGTERFVDGELGDQAARRALGKGQSGLRWAAGPGKFAATAAAFVSDVTYIGDPVRLVDAIRYATSDVRAVSEDNEHFAQALLLRDIFGPILFRTVDIASSLRAPAVLAIAQRAYEERTLPGGALDASTLSILADALEEAGCANHAILEHFRGPGPHVRGCWPLDLVLERPSLTKMS